MVLKGNLHVLKNEVRIENINPLKPINVKNYGSWFTCNPKKWEAIRLHSIQKRILNE